ncbi:MAG: hypothetical protein ACT4PG_12715 [Panacagrimonas sp.]
MTVVGSGGVELSGLQKTRRFDREFLKLCKTDPKRASDVESALNKLLKNPRPAGISFEKLKGYSAPDIYSIHVDGNYKISLEIDGGIAILRRVATHNEIDRQP